MGILMLYLIAQSTRPVGGFASFSAAEWIAIIGAVGALITGVIAAWRRAGVAKDVAHEANATASEAFGGIDAMQHTVTRISARQNEQDTAQKQIALAVQPPPAAASATTTTEPTK